MVEACHLSPDIKYIVVPKENEKDVSWLRSVKVKIAYHISEVIDFVRGNSQLETVKFHETPLETEQETRAFDSIIGQGFAKKAMAIALAATSARRKSVIVPRHHFAATGRSPGSGPCGVRQCSRTAPQARSARSRGRAPWSSMIARISAS